MKQSLSFCTSLVALTVATGGALAQSDRVAPGGAGNSGATETAPPSGTNPPSSRADPGSSAPTNPSADTAPSERKMPQARNAEDKPQKAGDAAKSDPKSETNSGSSAASKGNQKLDAARSSEKQGNSANDSSSSGASEGAQGKESASGSVTQLSGEQRTKVQSAFRSHKSQAAVKDLNISVSIGIAIPRHVTLYAVPEEVVVIVPAYRRYKYFIYQDKVLIVDPVTYEIIDILILA